MKIVINRCFGGFGLSDAALKRLGIDEYTEVERNDPRLVAVVEELGDAANDGFSKLKVVEIPDNVEWEIIDYGGMEHVVEKHRTWG